MTAAAAPVSPMDPRLALLVAAHDQTHHDLASLADEVHKNHDELSNRIGLLDTKTEFVGARITAEVGLINRKLDDIERNGALVKDHVMLMTGKFGELDKKVTLLDERVTSRLDGIDTRLDGIDTRLDGIDTRLDGIDTRLDGIDTRLDAMDTRFDGIDQRLDGIDTRLDGIDTQLGTIVGLLTAEPRE
jgi:tetrahydromethanopterin S-methyltransferase subunit G